MNDHLDYRGYRFPPEIISHTIWLYHRFTLSLRDIEDLLAERGIVVSYETIRQWCAKFGPQYARTIKTRQGQLGDTWYMDETVIVTIRGLRCYLWRAVDQDGDVIDILVQARKDKQAAKRFFKKLLKGQGRSPRVMVTDKLRSYGAARKDVMPSVVHCQGDVRPKRGVRTREAFSCPFLAPLTRQVDSTGMAYDGGRKAMAVIVGAGLFHVPSISRLSYRDKTSWLTSIADLILINL